MQTITINGQQITYLDEGNGRPLLLLHANPGNHQDFAAIIPELTKQFRVLALDWPGFGPIAGADATTIGLSIFVCNVLATFIQELDLTDAILIGNSVGGFAATKVAIEHPERVSGLVLVSPGGFTNHNLFTTLFCRAQGSDWLTKRTVKLFAQYYLYKDTAVTQAMLKRSETNQKTDTAVAVNAAIWRSFLQPEHDLREKAKTIQCPTLVVSGKHDPVIPADKDGKTATAAIPNARQVILDTGHAPFAEDPATFLAVVNPFFAEHGLISTTTQIEQ